MACLEAATAFEQRVLTIPECFLYKIPPLKSSSGHRAETWGLGSPSLVGRIELIGVGTVLEIRIFDHAAGCDAAAVAICPVRCEAQSPPVASVVDPVIDSSRYFVLRCEDADKRVAYIGTGFTERETAYDFKAAVQDFWRCAERERRSVVNAQQWEERTAYDETRGAPDSVDLKLKGSIKIRLSGGGEEDEDEASAQTGKPSPTAPRKDAPVPLLAPPRAPPPRLAPPPQRATPLAPRPATTTPPPDENHPAAADAATAEEAGADDDFGDFESAVADFEAVLQIVP